MIQNVTSQQIFGLKLDISVGYFCNEKVFLQEFSINKSYLYTHFLETILWCIMDFSISLKPKKLQITWPVGVKSRELSGCSTNWMNSNQNYLFIILKNWGNGTTLNLEGEETLYTYPLFNLCQSVSHLNLPDYCTGVDYRMVLFFPI